MSIDVTPGIRVVSGWDEHTWSCVLFLTFCCSGGRERDCQMLKVCQVCINVCTYIHSSDSDFQDSKSHMYLSDTWKSVVHIRSLCCTVKMFTFFLGVLYNSNYTLCGEVCWRMLTCADVKGLTIIDMSHPVNNKGLCCWFFHSAPSFDCRSFTLFRLLMERDHFSYTGDLFFPLLLFSLRMILFCFSEFSLNEFDSWLLNCERTGENPWAGLITSSFTRSFHLIYKGGLVIRTW